MVLSPTAPNKADAPDPAMTHLFRVWSHRRRVGDLRRSAKALAHEP